MLHIDLQGMLTTSRVQPRRFTMIERSPMKTISGIVVHQTGSANEQSVFASYRAGGNGAHFLIGKNGVIYQTASVNHRTNHVGPLKARCLAEHRCTAAAFQKSKEFPQGSAVERMNKIEMTKAVPVRYPSNVDSIGIEIVGMSSLPPNVRMPAGLSKAQQDAFLGEKSVYEPVNAVQNDSLRWLINGLTDTLRISSSEIHRHPDVSRKNVTEASTASWR
ncbi:peptidoglycan recognition protein family protein [Paracidovorax konjaci]|uniref:N-acetylmuramoyl-L-alanine amidase n=1 Tax=Paracidovorax konjaci TaxID=32040 RepID=A0A1I1VIA1_9BURK|nr:N-acetylmuramoyl-L-alanine amidase [Paracidovorax konjaci]SFD80813.1 N-acetylmuramoyl-L-alanine amidase [Paracidovorax konjaci]